MHRRYRLQSIHEDERSYRSVQPAGLCNRYLRCNSAPDADELMDNPIHPYTQSLLSAVPIPDPETARHSKRIVLEGDVPSPLRMPSGCPFRSRCKYATEQCAAARPELTDRGNGHMVACFNR